MKHVVSLLNFSGEEIESIVLLALEMKRNPEKFFHTLSGKWLLMLFQKTSTRTRISFEMGMKRLGGESLVLDWDKSNFAISPIKYEAQYVSRQVDVVMARLKEHGDIQELAAHATIPVINGCDNRFHPCQALADLITVYEDAGKFSGETLTYTGVHNNVANSLAIASARVGLHLILVTPETNAEANQPEMMKELMATGHVEQMNDLNQAARRSSYVYTDTWVDMEFFQDPAYQQENERRILEMTPFQLNKENLAGSEAKILHDMPIHPGYEISEEMANSPRSLILTQAENRMYAQQALLIHLLK